MKRYMMKFFYSFLEYLALFPIFLWFNGLLLSNTFHGFDWFYLLGYYWLGIMVGSWFNKQVLQWGNILLLSGIFIYFFDMNTLWITLLVFVLMSAILYRGILYANESSDQIFRLELMWAFSVPLYFISYPIFRWAATFDYDENLLSFVGIVFIVLLLFLLNNDHLKNATLAKGDRKRINHKVQRQNRFYLIMLFVVVFLITQYNVVRSVLSYFARSVFQFFLWLLQVFQGSPEEEGRIGPAGEMDFFVTEETSERSRLAEIIDQILYTVITILIIIAVLILVYITFKKLSRLLVRFSQFVRHIIGVLANKSDKWNKTSKTGYDDEKESLLELNWHKKIVDNTKKFVRKKFAKRINWEKLTDQEKVRFLYKQFIIQAERDGYQIQASDTALEAVTLVNGEWILTEHERETLAKLYNKARYSNEPLEDVKILDQFTKLHHK